MSKAVDLTKDKRSAAMAQCMVFAMRSWPNRAVISIGNGLPTTWHKWFRDVLLDAGFKLIEEDPGKATKKNPTKTKRGSRR